MNIRPFQRAIAPLVLSVLLLTACGSPSSTPTSSGSESSASSPTTTAPSPATTAAEATSALKDIAGLPPQKGSAFNKFFPKGEGDFKVNFTQEKEGFAEIKVSKAGTELAKISISDTVTNLTARDKFAGAADQVSGFPMVAQGKKATAALVGDRYQVKVMSRDASFTDADRQAWLAKVDLTGLAQL